MTTQFEIAKENTFDQIEIFSSPAEMCRESQEIGTLVLDVSQITIDFASVERAPRYYEHRKENNAEHSFMLGLLAMEAGTKYYPGLDVGLMTQFALVHDLVELETKDLPTFKVTDEELQLKHQAEQDALQRLQDTLPAYLADMLTWYEEQEQPEARLVRHLDKLLPYAVDINGAGLTVMREYGVTTATQLLDQNKTNSERFRDMFPEKSHEILIKAHNVLANKFALQFEEA